VQNIATWYLQFTIYDAFTANTYKLPSFNSHMFPGSTIGDVENTCYLPIFSSSLADEDDTWYIGNLFINYFYMVYDMTPMDELGKDYI
jgi:hypothetical protein